MRKRGLITLVAFGLSKNHEPKPKEVVEVVEEGNTRGNTCDSIKKKKIWLDQIKDKKEIFLQIFFTSLDRFLIK